MQPTADTQPDRLAPAYGPPLFGFIGGYVDVCGFIALGGLFVAHFTGNLAVLGAAIVRHPSAAAARLLALPEFVLTVAAMGVLAPRFGHGALRFLIVTEAALLIVFLAGLLAWGPFDDMAASRALLVAAVAIAAMGVQNTATRLGEIGTHQTTAMTGNLTRFTLDLLHDRKRAGQSGMALLVFVLGSAAGGTAWLLCGAAALGLPILLLLVFLVTPLSRPASG